MYAGILTVGSNSKSRFVSPRTPRESEPLDTLARAEPNHTARRLPKPKARITPGLWHVTHFQCI
jgi:hypothetical protein